MHLHRRSPAPRRRGSKRDAGFTLIELLVTITILGVLAGIVIFAIGAISDKGKTSSVAEDARILRTAEEANCAKFGTYATVDELVTSKLLATRPTYNSVTLSDDDKCGTGPKSAFSIFDASAPTEFLDAAVPVGATPGDIAVNPDTNRIYVLNSGASPTPTVSVIDGRTDTVIGQPIPVGAGDNGDRLAVNAHNNKIYVTNTNANSISVIDANDNNRVTEVPFTSTDGGGPVSPRAIIAVPGNDRVYAIGAFDPGIMSLDGSNARSWLGPDFFADGGGLPRFALNTKTDTVYIVGTHGGIAPLLAAIHGTSMTTADLPEAQSYEGLVAVDSSTGKVYTTGSGPVNASFVAPYWTMVTDGSHIDNTTVAVKETAAAPAWSNGIVVNPNTHQAFILGTSTSIELPSVVGRFDGTSNTYTGQLLAGQAWLFGVLDKSFAVNPNTNRVYFAPQRVDGGGAVYPGGLITFDGSTLLPQTLADQTRGFAAIAVNPVTNKIYATDPAGNSVAVVR